MSYVTVEIDLDEIDTDDLVRELCDRLKAYGRRKLKDDDRKEIAELIEKLNIGFSVFDGYNIQLKTIDDKMKIEHLSNVWNKYTSFQMEEKLP